MDSSEKPVQHPRVVTRRVRAAKTQEAVLATSKALLEQAEAAGIKHPTEEAYWAEHEATSFAVVVVDTSRDGAGNTLQRQGGSHYKAVPRVSCLLSGLPSFEEANFLAMEATYLLRLRDYTRSSKETYVAIGRPPQVVGRIWNEKISYRVPPNLPLGNRLPWLAEQIVAYDTYVVEPFEAEQQKMVVSLVARLKKVLPETTPPRHHGTTQF